MTAISWISRYVAFHTFKDGKVTMWEFDFGAIVLDEVTDLELKLCFQEQYG